MLVAALIAFCSKVNKLNTIIQLLMGDIPDRRLFNQKDIRQALLPYSKIVQVPNIASTRSGSSCSGLNRSFSRLCEQEIWLFLKV